MNRSLVTLSTLTLPILHVYLATGCSGQFAAGARARGPVPAAPEEMAEVDEGGAPAGPVHASGEDRHWMQADDYFISELPWQQSWIYVHLSKMKQPPGPGHEGAGAVLPAGRLARGVDPALLADPPRRAGRPRARRAGPLLQRQLPGQRLSGAADQGQGEDRRSGSWDASPTSRMPSRASCRSTRIAARSMRCARSPRCAPPTGDYLAGTRTPSIAQL